MFILPSITKNPELLDEVQFMASNRHPLVVIEFENPDFRFYLSLKELLALRNYYAVGKDKSEVYCLLANFEYEAGDRVKSLKHGVDPEFATVVRVTNRHGAYTKYEVKPDIPPPPQPAPSRWRRWRNRIKPAPAPEPIIWLGEVTHYLKPDSTSPSTSLNKTEQD